MSITVCNGKYTLLKKIGKGAFGDVFLGKTNDLKTVAIKIERVGVKHPQLHIEHAVYTVLNRLYPNTFAQVFYFGRDGDYFILVLQQLGIDLDTFLGTQIDVTLVMHWGRCILEKLEKFHNAGFVHRDLKPANLLLSSDKTENNVYIIDFGLSKFIRTNEGHHLPINRPYRFIGTPRYASIWNHQRVPQSRRDDLMSLGYILAHLLLGTLPWEGMHSHADILALKKTFIAPPELVPYFQHVERLNYTDRPDYEQLTCSLQI